MDDQLRNAIDAIGTRLQAELEAQLEILQRAQRETIEAARRASDVEAHERWAVKLEQVRLEWASRLETELAAAAADADRRTVAECTRARLETEQASAESMAQLRQETTAELERGRAAAEETRASADRARVEAEKAATEIAQMRDQFESERRELHVALEAQLERVRGLTEELEARSAIEAQRAAAASALEAEAAGVTEARAVERQSQLAIVERLLESVRAISSAQSLTEVLDTLIAGAAGEVPRAALLLVEGQQLHGFRVSGFEESVASAGIASGEGSALQQAIETGEPVSVTSANAPPFGTLPADRAGLVVPINVGGRAVAVLYADDASPGEPDAPASWPEAIQILSQHAAAALAHLTAVRSAQALRYTAGPAARAVSASSSPPDDDQAARRYARLLVSEIKLYNEVAVRVGREKRDLLSRLGPEVERARRLYEERVPPAVSGRGTYFQQELVQTLADGDAGLLGTSAVSS